MSALRTLLIVTLLLSAACSQSGEPAGRISGDEVTIEMRDSFYSPDKLTVRRGQRVTFRFENEGKLRHDAFIGDADAQGEHEEEARMADDEDHGGHGGGDDGIIVEPGESGTLSYHFSEPGEILIGCHEPGHYGAGMVVAVTVT